MVPLRPQLPQDSGQMLVGDLISTALRSDLDGPIGQVSREQLRRARLLEALALGLNPSDLREPSRRLQSVCTTRRPENNLKSIRP